MLIEISAVIGVFIVGYSVGRLTTQAKFDKILLRRGRK